MNRLCLLTFVLAALLPPFAAAQEPGSGTAFVTGADMDGGVSVAQPGGSAVARGASYMGFTERFNRYYTDPAWKPLKTIYVSPNGSGNGQTHATPMSVPAGINAARAGTKLHFVRGTYNACYELPKERSGTYVQPIVLYGERDPDKSIGVTVNCCNSGRRTCFNLEASNYVALDGFELAGGDYGVRVVGAGYPASQHSRGIAVLNSRGHDQNRDPFFSGQSDWDVWQGNVAYGAGAGDGHGIYLSNGSDWNIVRLNETYSNSSSDFQINADPASTCQEDGIPFNDPRCDDYAGTGEGGRGASDYFLVDANYFHHSDVGPNFTSVRRSVIRNNIFGPQTRHNVSFWQETSNPKLGARENKILHNLFITTDRHGVQFSQYSTLNQFVNNVLVGVRASGGKMIANPSALLMEVDNTVSLNTYRTNLYSSGMLEGRTPNAQEIRRTTFAATWFRKFPVAVTHDPNTFTPTASAPFLELGTLSPLARTDRNRTLRAGKVDLGPIEIQP